MHKEALKLIAALLIGLAAVIQAHGQGIVYYSYGAGVQVGDGQSRTEFPMDLNSDGVNDFRFIAESAFAGGFYLEPRNHNKVLGYPADRLATAYRVRRLVGDADISSIMASGLEWVGYQPNPVSSVTGPFLFYSLSRGQGVGEFAPTQFGQQTEGYVGIQFIATDGLHYGWIRVRGGYYNDGTILDYAYNTVPGQSISAGAVPEPSIWALIGLGAVGLWRFRRDDRDATTRFTRKP